MGYSRPPSIKRRIASSRSGSARNSPHLGGAPPALGTSTCRCRISCRSRYISGLRALSSASLSVLETRRTDATCSPPPHEKSPVLAGLFALLGQDSNLQPSG